MDWAVIFIVAGLLLWIGIRRSWQEDAQETARADAPGSARGSGGGADGTRVNAREDSRSTSRQSTPGFVSEDVPCSRCGDRGTTRPFTGPEGARHFYRVPLNLCLACTLAQESFINNIMMLRTEERFHFGRSAAIAQARSVWGPRAIDMLALLAVARDSMDSARRILDPESFEELRPWLEQQIGAD